MNYLNNKVIATVLHILLCVIIYAIIQRMVPYPMAADAFSTLYIGVTSIMFVAVVYVGVFR